MEDFLIKDQIEKDKKRIIDTRRKLHRMAEVSGKEFNTSRFLKEEVEKLGLAIVEVSTTGFYAVLDSGRPGRTLALRTDIDALPICENSFNLTRQKYSVSDNKEASHACGHDGHMTILLESMKLLVENKDKIKGRIIFIFEEGEETGCGIIPMIKALEKENIDAFYGNHLANFLKTGEIAIDKGPIMAGFIRTRFTIKGVGGHSSRPDLAVSPIFAQAAIIQSLASSWVNRLDPSKTVTLGLSTIHGGSAHNVIADKVTIDGTLRFFDREEVDKAIEQIDIVGKNIAKAHGCDFINETGDEQYDPVINDPDLSRLMKENIKDYFGDKIKKDVSWFASESFELYGKLAPSLFALVGMANDKKGSGAEHHTPEFDLDEDSLDYGIFAMVKFATSFLANN